MPAFVLIYRQPAGYTPTAQSAAAWRCWFDSMGDQLTDLGKPAVARASLGESRPDRTQLGGYSMIEADDLEAALTVAKGCPHLQHGGGVDVGELGEVPPHPADQAAG